MNANKRNFYTDFDGGLAYLFAIVVPIIVGMILNLIFSPIAAAKGLESFTQSPLLYSLYILFVNGSLLGVFFVYNKVAKTNFVRAGLIKFKFGWVNLIMSIVVAIVTLFGSLYLINYLTYLMKQIGYNPDGSLPLPLTNAGWLVLNLLLLAVLPAICEELVFRGIVFNGLRKFGNVAAIFISALFFALAHGSAMQFFYQFALGLVLAAVVYKTGSIVASMVTHFVNNATVVVYNYIAVRQGISETEVFTPNLIAISFLVAILAGLVLWLILRGVKERKGKTEEISANETYNVVNSQQNKKFSSKASTLFFFLGLGISVLVWCLGTFLG